MGEDGGGREGWKVEGKRKGGGRWSHPASVFSPCIPGRGACTAACRAPPPPQAPLWVALPSCQQVPQVRPPRPTCLPVRVPRPSPESRRGEGPGSDRSPAQPASPGRLQPRRHRFAPPAVLSLAPDEGRGGPSPAGVSWVPLGGRETCLDWVVGGLRDLEGTHRAPRRVSFLIYLVRSLTFLPPLSPLSSSARSMCEEGPPSRVASPQTPPISIKSERLSPATGASSDFPRPYPYPLLLTRPLAEPLRPAASLSRLTPDGWPR